MSASRRLHSWLTPPNRPYPLLLAISQEQQQLPLLYGQLQPAVKQFTLPRQIHSCKSAGSRSMVSHALNIVTPILGSDRQLQGNVHKLTRHHRSADTLLL